jgi:DNA-binding transcriptional regulator YhcF (GntR family)
MPVQKKVNETLYTGRSKWLRVPDDYKPRNGENVIETDDVIKKVQRNGFEITYLSYFFDLFDQLAGKKYQVVKYILANKNSDNQLIITNRELAVKSKTSLKTVVDTIKLLKSAGLIETRTGSIMLHPRLSHRGSDKRERFLLQKFTEFPEPEDANQANHVD